MLIHENNSLLLGSWVILSSALSHKHHNY